MEVENCYGCGGCVAVCPTGAITIIEEVEIDAEKCVKCGRCELMCPAGLIRIDGSQR
ncbi:MAG: 4Fe-4S binding protein [Candidatus Altiarchaeota archaeon]|nr:4Fe-4S binding protein [Candidatus Altiarchaeota archaeon]